MTFTLVLLLALGGWSSQAWAQDATNSASVAKPVLPANPADSKTELPAGADTTPPRVADVHPSTYIIGTEDVLTINVWHEPEISKVVPVRPDGMISLPLVGEIQAKGLTPVQLEDQITTALKKVISDPQVTVMVTQVNSLSFNVVGNVLKPGYYALTRRMTVLDAIALAVGFRDFAKEKKIYVLRTSADGKQVKLKFNYKDVIKGKHPDENIELKARDTLVVP